MTRHDSETSESVFKAYFYCDFRRPGSEDPVNVIGSLVAQICSQLGSFPAELEAAFAHSSSGGAKRRPEISVLTSTLVVLAKENKIILLIDALDECSKRGDMLTAISNLKEADNIQIFITSRAEPEIPEGLDFFRRLKIESNLQAVDLDIRNYINRRLESDRKLLWLKPALKSDIIESLNKKSQGM